MEGIAIKLATFVFFANGGMQPHQTMTVPGDAVRALQTCWAMADTFVKTDPAALGGVALGAGCIVQRGTKS